MTSYTASLKVAKKELTMPTDMHSLAPQGPVRRIHFAPPAAEELTRGGSAAANSGTARASVLFANGTFGIWELDARNDLKPVR